jgi:hypothetical protein
LISRCFTCGSAEYDIPKQWVDVTWQWVWIRIWVTEWHPGKRACRVWRRIWLNKERYYGAVRDSSLPGRCLGRCIAILFVEKAVLADFTMSYRCVLYTHTADVRVRTGNEIFWVKNVT